MLIKKCRLITRELEKAEGRAKRFFPRRGRYLITLLRNEVNGVNINRDETKQNNRESHGTSPSMVVIFQRLRNGVKKTDWGYDSTVRGWVGQRDTLLVSQH